MSVAMENALCLPGTPDKRLLEPPTPSFKKTTTVTLHGYIGKMTEEFIHFHHMLDYRAYYLIPTDGIKSCDPVESQELEELFKLEIYEETPLRYFHSTTVDLKAGILAHAVQTYNTYASGFHEQARCPATCPRGCCSDGACLCNPSFPVQPGVAMTYGLTVSTPDYPKSS